MLRILFRGNSCPSFQEYFWTLFPCTMLVAGCYSSSSLFSEKWRNVWKVSMGGTPIFHWTMIRGGRARNIALNIETASKNPKENVRAWALSLSSAIGCPYRGGASPNQQKKHIQPEASISSSSGINWSIHWLGMEEISQTHALTWHILTYVPVSMQGVAH